MPAFTQPPVPRTRLRILSHNPLVPVLVPMNLMDRYGTEAQEGSHTVSSVGPLTRQSLADERRWDTEHGLAKLVLQIAHICNLTCSYCISDSGRWGSAPSGLMSAATAKRALRFFAEQYGSIGTIYLFGGEPTLNLPCIEAVCAEAEALVDDGVLSSMPDIGFTSNGTIVNDRLLKLLREKPYLKMSVSMDGPAHIHDVYRLDAGGHPTYNRILRNIRKLRDETGRPKTLEITYNLSHQRSEQSLWEIMTAIRQDTGIRIIGVEVAYNTTYSGENFDPLIERPDDALADIEDAIHRSLMSIAASDDPIYYYHIIAFMQVLFQQHRPNFCPAARNYFTVSKDGGVYPCQNLPENAETLIGTIGDPHLAECIRHNPIIDMIGAANQRANEALGESWFANFCKICPAYNIGETGAMATLAQSRVALYERMASTFLAGLLSIAEDDATHARFVQNIDRTKSEIFELNMF